MLLILAVPGTYTPLIALLVNTQLLMVNEPESSTAPLLPSDAPVIVIPSIVAETPAFI